MSTRPDAVVIGAGPNGLVAANRLTDAGWSVLVLEAQPEPGGAVRSSRDVHPDFVHDTFSSSYPLAAASKAITRLGLERHGLRWAHAPAPLGHPTADGWAMLQHDRHATAAGLEADHAGDGERWLELCRQWDVASPHLVGLLTTPFPPVRHGLGLLTRLPRLGGVGYLRTLLLPLTELAAGFGGSHARLLLAGNAAHGDIPLDSPGSGLLGLLLAMLAQDVGFPVAEGGSGELTAALVRRLEAGGGELRCSSPVVRVEVERGRAAAVRTAAGERIAVGRAVLADVGAHALYGSLLDPGDVPGRTRRAMNRFSLDPATVKIDIALSAPVPWRVAPALAPGVVHVSDSLPELLTAQRQVADGLVPADPFLLVGLTTTADPSRSPAGTESLWAYAHVPQPGATLGDAGADRGAGAITGAWDAAERERFGDRVVARLESLAPGLGERVQARRVLGPRELEAADANLVGGALNGGTAQLHQQLVFRPVPGLGRAQTPVGGLFLASAAAHPGGGVHGACGDNAARGALAAARLGLLPRR